MSDQDAEEPFEPHTIELTIDRRCGFSHKFRCIAPVGSPCRLVFPEVFDSAECNYLLFLDNDEAELWELYDGEPTGARSGHVALSYDGDAVTWHYLPHPIDDPARAEIEARDKERADA